MNPFYAAIAERANHRCEYCRAPEVVFNFPFEIEHIIPISKQGRSETSNLALACRSYNLRKGNRISAITANSVTKARFFHPRIDQWKDHFEVDADSGKISGKTEIGIATVDSLSMNSQTQVIARQLWIRLELFP